MKSMKRQLRGLWYDLECRFGALPVVLVGYLVVTGALGVVTSGMRLTSWWVPFLAVGIPTASVTLFVVCGFLSALAMMYAEDGVEAMRFAVRRRRLARASR